VVSFLSLFFFSCSVCKQDKVFCRGIASTFLQLVVATMIFSFSTRSTWSTASKALERSNKTAPVKPPLSIVCILNLLQVDLLAIGASFFRSTDRPTDEVARGWPFVPRHIKSD